jgi:hypothetical protein
LVLALIALVLHRRQILPTLAAPVSHGREGADGTS